MKVAIALLLLVAVVAYVAEASRPVHLPLVHRARSAKWARSMLKFAADNAAGKYITLPRDSANLPLVNDDELDYTCLIGLGTPVQSFSSQDLDTGSSNLWVSSTKCTHCGFPAPPFNPSASHTYVPNGEAFSITYGSGSITGTLAQDTLTIAGLVVEKQVFGLVNTAQGFQGAGITGLLGLAFQSIASDNVVTPLQNMFAQDLISQYVFAFYLSSDVSTPGQVTFGGYDASLMTGSISYIPIVDDQWYVINVGKVTFGGVTISQGGRGIVDTGTTVLLVPTAVGSAVTKAVKLSKTCASSNMNNPILNITLGEIEFSISPAQYIIQVAENECMLGIQGGNIGDGLDYILGDVFLRSVYTIFEPPAPGSSGTGQIGFAALAPGLLADKPKQSYLA